MEYDQFSQYDLGIQILSKEQRKYTKYKAIPKLSMMRFCCLVALLSLVVLCALGRDVFIVEFAHLQDQTEDLTVKVIRSYPSKYYRNLDVLLDHNETLRVLEYATDTHVGSYVRIRRSLINPQYAYVINYSITAEILHRVAVPFVALAIFGLAFLFDLRSYRKFKRLKQQNAFVEILRTNEHEIKKTKTKQGVVVTYAPIYKFEMRGFFPITLRGAWGSKIPQGEVINKSKIFRLYMDPSQDSYYIEIEDRYSV